jgi:hypothetical protein
MGTAWNVRSLLYLLAHPKPTIPVPEGALILWNVMRHVDQLCRDGHISGKEGCDIQDTCLKLLQEFREEAGVALPPK